MYKHPRALIILFFTEMWERFSFYGMRALLMLYLTMQLFRDLQEPDKKAIAYGIYAAYGSLVYATPFIGGIIADKFLGHRKSVVWGAILMAIGHFVMAVETQFWLYIALAFLIIGNGFFKPNMSSIIGEMYDEKDPRRDGGFTIFYMGINLGAFLSPILCGVIGETYGWKYGFSIAGIGMIAGLVWFEWGKKILDYKEHIVEKDDEIEIVKEYHPLGIPPQPEKLHKKLFLGITQEYLIYALSIISVALFATLIKNYQVMTYVLVPFSAIVLTIILVIAFRSTKIERDRLFVVLILLVFTTLFWAFFEQAGSSLTLFANENIDRNFFHWQVKASIFQSINPLFILFLATPFTMLWMQMARRKREPSTPSKFAFGILFLAFGFLILAISPYFITDTTLNVPKDSGLWNLRVAAVPMTILILSYLLQTIGELCLSPIGLSMVTKLASPKIVGMVMGAWFLSSTMAFHVGGFIANLTTEPQSAVEVMWKKFEPSLSKSGISLPAKEFEKRYKAGIVSALGNGFDVILDEGNTMKINSDKSIEFNKQRIYDSTFVVLKHEGVLNHISNIELFKSNIMKSFDVGISYMKESGNIATLTALNKDYIDKETTENYSLTTRYSMANLFQYTKVFLAVGIIALCASLLLFALSPAIKRMMHGV